MHGEVSWDHIDRLIEAYAASCLFVDARDLETRLSRAIADLQRYPATFDDLTSLLSTRSLSREMISRRIAWTAQHLFACRAWTVGTKVLTKLPGDQYASPLLDQLRTLGLTTRLRPGAVATRSVSASSPAASVRAPDSNFPSPDTDVAELEVIDGSPFTGRLAFSNIDAMLASPASDEVWLVKGCSYTQAARTSPDLWINADRTSLFGNNDRFLTNLFAPGAHVRTLLAARDLVQISHPGLKVRAAYLVANDPGCSWHFQCHDLTAARPAVARQSKLHLDAYPIHATYRDFPAHFAREALGFAPMPDFASGGGPRASGGLHRETATTPHGTTTQHAPYAPSADALSALPADRPTRALLLLQDLWTRQLNRPKRLASARADDLAASVTRNAALFMPKDQYRHDLEDCLERAHLVRRLPDHPGRFAITPKGVGRLLLLRQKLGRAPDLTTPQLLSHITHQARLWAAAPVA